MEEINEFKLPKGVDRISVKQHDDKIVIEFIPKKPQFKNGDFVYEDGRIMIVKSYPKNYHANIYPKYSAQVLYNSRYGLYFSEPTFRYATDEEKQILVEAMKKDGKRWNAEKLIIEDIPKRKFKSGDKVTLKSGCTSNSSLIYLSTFNEYIGKELIVFDYVESGNIFCNNGFYLHEDWLEPYTEELKKGDLAIFWDNNDNESASIRMYDRKDNSGYYDSCGFPWDNAIKFESTVQFGEVLNGKV